MIGIGIIIILRLEGLLPFRKRHVILQGDNDVALEGQGLVGVDPPDAEARRVRWVGGRATSHIAIGEDCGGG